MPQLLLGEPTHDVGLGFVLGSERRSLHLGERALIGGFLEAGLVGVLPPGEALHFLDGLEQVALSRVLECLPRLGPARHVELRRLLLRGRRLQVGNAELSVLDDDGPEVGRSLIELRCALLHHLLGLQQVVVQPLVLRQTSLLAGVPPESRA